MTRRRAVNGRWPLFAHRLARDRRSWRDAADIERRALKPAAGLRGTGGVGFFPGKSETLEAELSACICTAKQHQQIAEHKACRQGPAE